MEHEFPESVQEFFRFQSTHNWLATQDCVAHLTIIVKRFGRADSVRSVHKCRSTVMPTNNIVSYGTRCLKSQREGAGAFPLLEEGSFPTRHTMPKKKNCTRTSMPRSLKRLLCTSSSKIYSDDATLKGDELPLLTDFDNLWESVIVEEEEE